MTENFKKILKNPKLLVILAVCGILLIFLSSVFTDNKKTVNMAFDAKSYTATEYKASLEKSVKSIVTGITGDKKPIVVITLESGVRYSYATIDEIDSSSSSGNSSDQSSESKKQSYITVKTADGGEQPLIITEIMPEVRGVAIICSGGNQTATAEKIKNAVTAALNITSKRVHISGGTK